MFCLRKQRKNNRILEKVKPISVSFENVANLRLRERTGRGNYRLTARQRDKLDELQPHHSVTITRQS